MGRLPAFQKKNNGVPDLMFYNLTVNVACVFLLMLPGYFSMKWGILTNKTLSDLSSLSINFIYPALIIYTIPSNFSLAELVENWPLPLCSFGIMSLGYMIGISSSSFMKFGSWNEKHGFLFQCVMNNYSFLPLPIVLTLFGEKGVAALIFSSLGAEVAVWTIGIFVLQGQKISFKNLKHLLSPPLISLYLSIIMLVVMHFTGGGKISSENILSGNFAVNCFFRTLHMLGVSVIPISMIVAGARIAGIRFTNLWSINIWILTFVRLALIPVAVIIILKLLPLPVLTKEVITVVAVMPTALASIILSEIYHGGNDFITLTVFTTHACSLFTIPLLLSIAL